MREQRRRVYKVGSQQHSLWTGYRGKREETVLVGRWWIDPSSACLCCDVCSGKVMDRSLPQFSQLLNGDVNKNTIRYV